MPFRVVAAWDSGNCVSGACAPEYGGGVINRPRFLDLAVKTLQSVEIAVSGDATKVPSKGDAEVNGRLNYAGVK